MGGKHVTIQDVRIVQCKSRFRFTTLSGGRSPAAGDRDQSAACDDSLRRTKTGRGPRIRKWFLEPNLGGGRGSAARHLAGTRATKSGRERDPRRSGDGIADSAQRTHPRRAAGAAELSRYRSERLAPPRSIFPPRHFAAKG